MQLYSSETLERAQCSRVFSTLPPYIVIQLILVTHVQTYIPFGGFDGRGCPTYLDERTEWMCESSRPAGNC